MSVSIKKLDLFIHQYDYAILELYHLQRYEFVVVKTSTYLKEY